MSNELSDFIRREIQRLGISERELSRRANLSVMTVNYVVKNPESRPNYETCVALAKVLEVPETVILQMAGYRKIDSTADLSTEVFALACYLDNLPAKAREYALQGCWGTARLVAQITEDKELHP